MQVHISMLQKQALSRAPSSHHQRPILVYFLENQLKIRSVAIFINSYQASLTNKLNLKIREKKKIVS